MKSDDAESVLSEEELLVQADADLILGTLMQKGNIIAEMRELLADNTKIKSTGIKLKQIFLEVVFTRFGAQSMEHVTRGVDKVKAIFQEQYHD